MITINPYLKFDGNCEEAFNFYKSVFGGEFPCVDRYEKMPPQEGCPEVAEDDKQKIMHISLPIGKNTNIMGSDVLHKRDDTPINSNVSLSINVDSKAEADRIFDELSSGGQVLMPLADTFWGGYFGMFTDKFNVKWMIHTEM